MENQPISGVTDFQIPLSSQNVAGTGTDETTKACVTLHGDAPMTKKVGEKLRKTMIMMYMRHMLT